MHTELALSCKPYRQAASKCNSCDSMNAGCVQCATSIVNSGWQWPVAWHTLLLCSCKQQKPAPAAGSCIWMCTAELAHSAVSSCAHVCRSCWPLCTVGSVLYAGSVLHHLCTSANNMAVVHKSCGALAIAMGKARDSRLCTI
jgi:hypothetical protein